MSGFTTQDINRCHTTAHTRALVYNWWSWCCRSANPNARMEAINSRPLLPAAVGKTASQAGQHQRVDRAHSGAVQTPRRTTGH